MLGKVNNKTILSIAIILVVLGGTIGVIVWQRGQVQEVHTTRSYAYLSVEELARNADIIVKAKLSDPSSHVGKHDISQRKIVLRSFPLKSQQTLKGNVSRTGSVEVRGGTATTEQGKTLKHRPPGTPDLKAGPEYVLFLRKEDTVSNDSYRVVGGSQGVYDVDGEMLLPRSQDASNLTLNELKKRIADSAIEEKTVAWNGLQLEYPTKRIDSVQKTRNKLTLSAGQDTLTLRTRKTGTTPKEYARERAKDVVSEKRRNSFKYLIDATVAGKKGISFANTEETRGATVVSWNENTLLHISWEVSEEKNLQTFRTIQGSIKRRL